MTVQTIPVAVHAPARAEPGHERVPAAGLDAQRHFVAHGATIAIREDEEEHDRCHDDLQHEEANQDDDENHGHHIRGQAYKDS